MLTVVVNAERCIVKGYREVLGDGGDTCRTREGYPAESRDIPRQALFTLIA